MTSDSPVALHHFKTAASAFALVALASCASDDGNAILPNAPGAEMAPMGAPLDPASTDTPAAGEPGAEGPGVSPEGPEVAPPPAGAECQSTEPRGGRAPMRRLTRSEYNATVQDLLGTELRVADGFAPEREQNGFLNSGDAVFFEERVVKDFMDGAEALSADARSRGVLTRDCAATGVACATTFIEEFGRRAFRRPLTPVEVQDHVAVFEEGFAEDGVFETGLEWVVQRMLQSVNFLYRVEPLPADFTQGQSIVQLTDHAVASRLSYFLLQTMPDEQLLVAADQQQLRTPAQIAAQVTRLMADARFTRTLAQFHRQWFRYAQLTDKLATIEPAWDGALRDALNEEADLFIAELFKTGGTLKDLFTADFSMLNAQLAQFYGVAPPAGPGFQRVDGLPNRAGILTMASLLGSLASNSQSHPVKRGVVVRDRLLCQPLPSPPDDVEVKEPEVTPGVPTRERFEEHRDNPVCASCHSLIDPIGMGFENYDEFGRYREMDQGHPVDASGELTNVTLPPGEPAEYVGVQELGAKLALTKELPKCMTTQWFRFSMGRNIEETDKCSISKLNSRIEASGFQLAEVVQALTASDLFLYRSLEEKK